MRDKERRRETDRKMKRDGKNWLEFFLESGREMKSDKERQGEWRERWREIKRDGETGEKELESESAANRTRNPAKCDQTRSKMELIREVLPCSFTQ